MSVPDEPWEEPEISGEIKSVLVRLAVEGMRGRCQRCRHFLRDGGCPFCGKASLGPRALQAAANRKAHADHLRAMGWD